VIIAEQHFKWDGFLNANANLGLFAQRKLIDLRIPSGKPGVEGAKALESYVANLNPDNVTLVTLPRMDRAAQASAWFTSLTRVAVVVAVQPLERAALPPFIAARLARQGQEASRETLALLAEQGEGNLLAVRQEVEKLALLLPAGKLDHDAVEAAIADVARFDVFALSEAWLAGDLARALRILTALRGESDPLTLVIWQLAADVHAIASVHAQMRAGTPLSGAIRNARVWGKRQSALERAVRRLNSADLQPLYGQLARLDALAKGIGRGNPWDELATAVLALAGKPILPMTAKV
jgi:DNA polymerase-3 subunit delta